MKHYLMRTSDTHPIRIDAVHPMNGWADIGLSLCPGKVQENALTGRWNRNLTQDLGRIRDWGAAMVISLIEAQEFDELIVSDLPAQTEALGMKWRHLPIRDRYPPGDAFHQRWPTIGHEIIATLAAGQRVFIHCKGGLGRTGVVAACLLIESGIAAELSVEMVRAARHKTIETAIQEWFVLNYSAVFRMQGSGEKMSE